MKNRKRRFKMLQVFIIGAAIAEFLITVAVLGLYYAISSLNFNFEAIYLSATSATILLITIVAVVITFRVGKYLLKPFMDIRKAAKDVTNGDFSVRLPENSGIMEISEVAGDFNKMVEELGNTEMFREDFVANVSHEFKTPLAVIEGYVTLLQGDITDNEKEEYINIILENTRRLGTLTGNILSLSKLENRELPLEQEKFRIDKQICDVIVEFNGYWESKGIEVEMELDKAEYTGYRALLSQVWSNLMQNAIKFTDSGGKIHIKCRRTEEQVEISFIDTGIGMDEETRKHIFDKFYQGERARSIEGNGLGLSLVKRILELSKGSITVTSEPGKGSCFLIILPADNI
jgi:signal transduction histidine kinase